MHNPLVSVVIPSYMGAKYLGEAIDSVLAQTYPNFEIVVVNDASPDDTDAVIAQYDDPRLRYIVHEKNQGAGVARDTATQAARGELIAFLDQDDYCHPEKLALHVRHFAEDPTLGASYTGRFELNPSSTTIRDIWQLPFAISLKDLVMGFPITPSDLVLRREWALLPDIGAVHEVFHGGEIIRYGRLYLAGCTFAPIERALTYHRYYAGRIQRNIERDCEQYLFAQNTIFDDERCPPEIRSLRPKAHTMSYLVWAGYALNQTETELAHKLLRKAAALTPTLAEGSYCELARFLLANNLENDFADHEAAIRHTYAQLPPELIFDRAQLERAIGQGYLIRGTRCLIWGRAELGADCFSRAAAMETQIDDSYVGSLTHQLLNYEAQFGYDAAQAALERIAPHLDRVSGRRTSGPVAARLAYNRALRHFHSQDYRHVPADCVRAIVNDPRNVTNRGVLSVFVRSLARYGKRREAAA
jgi:glycosyltransferase involved in cell wall biosynthesis